MLGPVSTVLTWLKLLGGPPRLAFLAQHEQPPQPDMASDWSFSSSPTVSSSMACNHN